MIKIFALLILSVLVVVITFNIYPSLKQKPQPNNNTPLPLASVSTLETQSNKGEAINWSTYTSSNHKFSIKVPPLLEHNSSSTMESFHQGEMTICCGYAGPNLNIFIWEDLEKAKSVGMAKADSDSVSEFVINGQELEELNGLGGIRIGILEHNKKFYTFQILAKDNQSDSYLQQIYQMLGTFNFTE